MKNIKQNYIKFYNFIEEQFINMELQEVIYYLEDRKQEIEIEKLNIKESFSVDQIELFIENSSYLSELKDFIIENYCYEGSENISQVKRELSEDKSDLFSIQNYLLLMASFKNHIYKEFEKEDSEIKNIYELMYRV